MKKESNLIENVEIYHISKYPRQANTADIVLLSIIDDELGVLCIKRNDNPFKGYWALPGGYIDNHKDETILDTAKRELEEETGLKNIYIEELGTFSKKNRDPRELIADADTRIISIAHYALIDHSKVHAIAGSDASDAKWFKISELPTLAFDHEEMVNKAIDRVRGKINYTNVGFELLPEKFTIPEIQKVLECVLGYSLDRNNFRTKILSLNILIELKERKKEGKGKPSPYYKLKKNDLSI